MEEYVNRDQYGIHMHLYEFVNFRVLPLDITEQVHELQTGSEQKVSL